MAACTMEGHRLVVKFPMIPEARLFLKIMLGDSQPLLRLQMNAIPVSKSYKASKLWSFPSTFQASNARPARRFRPRFVMAFAACWHVYLMTLGYSQQGFASVCGCGRPLVHQGISWLHSCASATTTSSTTRGAMHDCSTVASSRKSTEACRYPCPEMLV